MAKINYIGIYNVWNKKVLWQNNNCGSLVWFASTTPKARTINVSGKN